MNPNTTDYFDPFEYKKSRYFRRFEKRKQFWQNYKSSKLMVATSSHNAWSILWSATKGS